MSAHSCSSRWRSAVNASKLGGRAKTGGGFDAGRNGRRLGEPASAMGGASCHTDITPRCSSKRSPGSPAHGGATNGQPRTFPGFCAALTGPLAPGGSRSAGIRYFSRRATASRSFRHTSASSPSSMAPSCCCTPPPLGSLPRRTVSLFGISSPSSVPLCGGSSLDSTVSSATTPARSLGGS